MFYPEKMTLIRPHDRVLEIGPGAAPHHRSNAFLELKFETNKERISQRGNVYQEPNFGKRPVHYYDGGRFPFQDGEFDYVICSHVVEHVVDPQSFLNEIFRVGGGRGYLEYPLATYEYLYNFHVHLHFVKFDFVRKTLYYLPKCDTELSQFAAINSLFYKTLECGWDDLIASNKKLFFEGFEFTQPFDIEKTRDFEKLVPSHAFVVAKRPLRRLFDRIANKIGL
ncbi:MAG: hypothetical protein JG774_2072 [Desulfomicrobiaceae bacterium]|jgi:SAM-dependent methyltransferase|nr:hypothetical protein [Desulfomicrobiaceae bacterium]